MKESKASADNIPLIFKNLETKWYENEISNDPKTYEPTKDIEIISKYKNRARQILERDLINYEKFREKTRRSDHNWIKHVLTSGTTADKISANSILIQDSAVHNLKSLDALISMVNIKKKRECIAAIDALKEIFINNLLPNRPLKNFEEHSFQKIEKLTKANNEEEESRNLLLWYFESILKTKYQNFIRAVQAVFQDTIAATKIKLSSTITELLLASKHEQEKYLLEILINKLGDPDYKVASKIVFHLKRLLAKVPRKKLDTLLELERLVYRPNISPKAQYYSFCCMNQFVLTRHDQDIANRLMIIYFSFFKKYIKNKEIDSRMLNAILTGVNRAYKYAKMNHEEIDNNLHTLFKIVHVTNFNVSIQALMLLNQVVESRDDMLNRYYNALYRKMFDLESKNTSRQTYFLNLLYNSIIKDDAIPRIKAFVKRLLQVCFNQNVPFVCGALLLLSEVAKAKPAIFQFDNSLIVHSTPTTNSSSNGKGNKKFNEDDDEEERFVDAKTESTDDEREIDDNKERNGKRKKGKTTSWVHKNLTIHKQHDTYDYTQRNPLYSGADKTLTYELLHFSKHYHPTVALFANKLINGETIEYSGNPMEDFTLIHFLDRFVYKNPKKHEEKDGKSKKSLFGPKTTFEKANIYQIPINSKEYLNIDYKDIPEDEKFFYEYFKKQSAKKRDVGDNESETGSVSDSEFDQILAKTENDGGLADEDWTLDVADALNKNKKKGKKKKNGDEDGEDSFDSDIDESDEDDDDAGANGGGDDDDYDDDELAEAMKDEDFGDEDDDDDIDEGKSEEDDDIFEDSKKKKKNLSKKLGKSGNIHDLFAAADEFSELINDSQKYEEKGLGFLSNRDNADAKQLQWELNRFNDKRDKIRNKKKFNKKKIGSKQSDKKPKNNAKGAKVSKKPKKLINKSKKKVRFNKKMK